MKINFLIMICSILFFTGCSSVGTLPYGGATTTDLHDNNFKMIKANARGEDTGFYLLGLIPIVSPSYSDAMRDLHTEVNMEGRSTALANVAQDRSTLYLILFSIPKVTVTADIIEFIDDD